MIWIGAAALLLVVAMPADAASQAAKHEQCQACRVTCERQEAVCRVNACEAEGLGLLNSPQSRMPDCSPRNAQSPIAEATRTCKSEANTCWMACFETACDF